MKFIFEQKDFIYDDKFYQVANVNSVFETDLFEDDLINIKIMLELFKNTLSTCLIHIDKSDKELIEQEMQTNNINYRMIDLGRNNIFLIIHSISNEQEAYIVEFFYYTAQDNKFAILCLGEGITFDFEQIKQNKISDLFFGEIWIPKFTLVHSTACVFIRYDGMELNIAGNAFPVK